MELAEGASSDASGARHLHFVARDSGTNDEAALHVYVHDNRYTNADRYSNADLGITESVPWSRIWNLQRIETRTAKAAGGTKSLLQKLGEHASAEQAWVYVEVQPYERCRTKAVCKVLKDHGGFKASDEEIPALMVREP